MKTAVGAGKGGNKIVPELVDDGSEERGDFHITMVLRIQI
jgi:hypothetical protein